MNRGFLVAVTLVLLFSSFSGCTFLRQTTFTVLSLTVDDAEGFTQLHLRFNTSGTATLTVLSPIDQALFSDEYYQGVHAENIDLSGYRRTPLPGTYELRAYDTSKNMIYHNDMAFRGQNLSVIQVEDDWWQNTSGTQLVALHLTVHNAGDFPSYPYHLIAQVGDATAQVALVPTMVQPHQSALVSCFVPLGPLSSKGRMVMIDLDDSEGRSLAQTTHMISSPEPVASWTYDWWYSGDQTLRLPSLVWFFEYYKGLSRFDLNDYAAYVFDPYDDSFIAYLAHNLVSQSHAQSDIARINFVASFVQSIPYMKDDPNNDSYEYPRYPLETLEENRGDCEDKAILGAALLSELGYNVSLLRLPDHMAVGVHLDTAGGSYTYYVDRYYYLEMTAVNSPLGRVPPEYQGLTNATVYPISSRPLLIHYWLNATRYTTGTTLDYIKLKILVKNLGSALASSYTIQGAFYDAVNHSYNENTVAGSLFGVSDEQIVDLQVNVPKEVSTVLRTRIYLAGVMVHERESSTRFP
jgi:predicted transglutaminase-like cysteine proteinase